MTTPIHVVTIMNYDDPRGVDMCRIWFYLMDRFNPGVRITVFHAGRIAKIAPFGSCFKNVEFLQLDMAGIRPYKQSDGYHAPSQELILSMWRHFDRYSGYARHLYVEADAFVLCSLDALWASASTKPYISFEERILENGLPLINTGVHSCYDMQGFVTYDLLLEQLRIDSNLIHIPIGEQGIINAYFRRLGYDCRSKDVDFAWNCWAVNCEAVRIDDSDIVINSGKATSGYWATDHLFAKCPWSWWDQDRRVKILHAFDRKFWDLPECKQLWDYCLGKVNSM